MNTQIIDLMQLTQAFSNINNTIVGCPKSGLVMQKGNTYHSLNLKDARVALDQGAEAMQDALDNKTVELASDFEF